MTHSAEILQFLMTHIAKILQLLKTHTHCRNSAVADEPGCLNTIHDDRYCRYSEPPMTHTQCRNYVASDYPGCINSTINDDPTGNRNYATPANPSCCRTKQSRFILKGPEDDVIFRINRHFSLRNLRFTVFKLKKESNR